MVHLASTDCEKPQTRRGQERRMALLLSANELFLDKGYDAVSLDDIVQHAGGSKASIYKYFGNKEGLFTAICDYRRELFFKDICIPFDFHISELRHYLAHTLINFYQHLIQPENMAFMRLVIEQAQRNPELALYLYTQGPQHIQQCIAVALDKGHQQGKLVCPNPNYSAMMFFGILRNFEWRILMGLAPAEDHQEMMEYIHYCVDLFLKGHQKA
ncbi:TetR/AcrR family transcriptional regulator [Acinetobacter radioresistens]|uniref:TetR/AcrR family transcriptional regulator n=1 Tax=Acinetobacter TaxID=469 RepID=UPI002004BEF6|nr:TetR/AcrR family transcriptional regulator [Acinetobacter radioresistens]